MKRLYFKKEEKVIRQVQGYIEIPDEYTQVYDDIMPLLDKFSSTEIKILLILSKRANEDNGIYITNHVYEEIVKDFQKKFTRRYFYMCIEKLTNEKMLVKLSKSSYHVNPLYIWRNEQKKRDELVEEIYNGNQFSNYKIVEEKILIEEPKEFYNKIE